MGYPQVRDPTDDDLTGPAHDQLHKDTPMSRKKKSARAAPVHDSAASRTRPVIGGFLNRHQTLSRIALAILVPVMFFAAVEGTLRLAGYGYPTSLYLPVKSVQAYGSNRYFGWRFFPRKITRNPILQSFAIDKPDDTCRIFVLGASAALGVPNSAFSFSRNLEVMLRSRYPGVRFEFVNTSLTAINSHIVLPIAEECADYDPDVFLVYLGNNEVIGPYGIGGSVSGVPGNLNVVRAGIAFRTTRLGQLGQSLVASSRKGEFDSEQWRGMQMYSRHMVRSGDPELDTVHENFRQNLRDICLAGANGGAKTVLSTVAVNLRHSPPFASVADSTAPAAALQHLQKLETSALDLLATGHPAAARDSLQLARQLDPGYANTHFLLGEAALALGDPVAAYEAFSEALEYDALRFRTDQRLNEIIRSTAASLAPEGVLLADTQQILRQSEPSGTGTPGRELFYEHVHLTFQGNYLVAQAVLPTVERALPSWVKARADVRHPMPSLEDCGRELMFTAANEYLNLSQIRTTVTPYPFSAQLRHDAMLNLLDEEMNRLRNLATPEVQKATVEAYGRAYRKNPQDLLLAFNYAKILSLTGNAAASNDIMQRILSTQPPATDLDEAAINQLNGGG
ncbi:MAG: hypothetical protein QNL91_07140 [Candidatus Krumholzibacteria bacterium]|nr:hypothetical protein [Candidatus Krumholzibacteria bacterium]